MLHYLIILQSCVHLIINCNDSYCSMPPPRYIITECFKEVNIKLNLSLNIVICKLFKLKDFFVNFCT